MAKEKDPNQQIIDEKLAEAESLIRECEAIADEHKLMFSFGLAYGMGGDYYGDENERDEDYFDGGWAASSRGC